MQPTNHTTSTRPRVQARHSNKKWLRQLALAAALTGLAASASAAQYTYKGELADRGKPAQGKYDLRIHAYADAAGKQPLGGVIENYAVPVTDGHFATDLDLPDSASGTIWIDVALRAQGDGGDFASLGDRESVMVTGGSCPGAWALDGNAGAPAGSFLGTTDSLPLVLKSSGQTLGTLSYVGQSTPVFWNTGSNVILGSPINSVGTNAFGATVLGGGGRLTNSNSPNYGNNLAQGNFSTTVGGAGNWAQGEHSLAAGYRAHAANRGSFIWMCADCGQLPPSAQHPVGTWGETIRNNEFVASAAGGFRLFSGLGGVGLFLDPSGSMSMPTNASGGGLFMGADGSATIKPNNSGYALKMDTDGSVHIDRPGHGNVYFGTNGYVGLLTKAHNASSSVDQGLQLNSDGSARVATNDTGTGPYVAAGSATWVAGSDRNIKTNIVPVDPTDVLARVLELPIATWNYKATSAKEQHMGAMAQDFHAAFGLNGDDDKGIAGVDADGVALAAIQGLNARLESQNAELRQRLDAEHDQLAAMGKRLDALEAKAGH